METYQIQRGVPLSATVTITDESVTPNVPLNITGLTVFISVKARADSADNDTAALISTKITSHTTPASGITLWEATAAETLIPVGIYKCDVRVYTAADDFINSTAFNIEIVDVITKRLT
jgi:hypothetical protein